MFRSSISNMRLMELGLEQSCLMAWPVMSLKQCFLKSESFQSKSALSCWFVVHVTTYVDNSGKCHVVLNCMQHARYYNHTSVLVMTDIAGGRVESYIKWLGLS